MTTITSTFKHALIYSSAGMLGKSIGFVMLPVYAHYLRGEGYGIIGIIDVVLSVLTVLIGYGVQGGMTRFYYDTDEIGERKSVVSTALYVMMTIVLTVSLPVVFFSGPVAQLAFGDASKHLYITIAIFSFIFDISSKNAEAYILIRQQSLFFSVLSIFRLTIALSLNIYLIVHLKLGVAGYLYSGLITAIIFSIINHFWAFYNVGFNFNKIVAVKIIRWSFPLIPGYIAMFFRTNIDRILLRTSLGLSMLGSYEMLFKFATLIGFLVVEPFNKIWNVKRFEIAKKPESPYLMSKVFNLHLSLTLFVSIILSTEIPILLRILTPQEFWLNGYTVYIAVMSRVILSSYYHFFFGLLYKKKTTIISNVQIFSALTSIALNALLIYPFGINGAVTASLLTNTFQSFLAYRKSQPFYYIPYDWRKIFYIFIIAFIIYFCIHLISLDRWEGIINNFITKRLTFLLIWADIEHFKNGKVILYIINNFTLILEGIIKFILSFCFPAFLIVSNILPNKRILLILKNRSFNVLRS